MPGGRDAHGTSTNPTFAPPCVDQPRTHAAGFEDRITRAKSQHAEERHRDEVEERPESRRGPASFSRASPPAKEAIALPFERTVSGGRGDQAGIGAQSIAQIAESKQSAAHAGQHLVHERCHGGQVKISSTEGGPTSSSPAACRFRA